MDTDNRQPITTQQERFWGDCGAVCLNCNQPFTPMRGSAGKFCQMKCHHEYQAKQRPAWYSCSRCLAEIGIGMTIQSRILRVGKKSLHKWWKKDGIKAKAPKCNGWRGFVCKDKIWWGDEQAGNMWLSEYRPKFPDWSYVWDIEKSRRAYHAMGEEEKRKRNQTAWLKRKAACSKNPEYKAKMMHQSRTWKANNQEKVRASVRKSIQKRKLIDPGFKVQCNLRHRLKEIMGKVKKGGTHHTNNLTGCSTRQLAKHLESQFRRGMTWENYGTKWHVDHILPCASFDHTDPRQVAQCWHWTNLRPLDAKQNMAKGATITDGQMNLLLCMNH
jgi:hypothetical protein